MRKDEGIKLKGPPNRSEGHAYRAYRGQPLSASAITNGKVALLSAKVDVRATAPGMLVTQ